MGCVYLITSPSGKQYVGQTIQALSDRWRFHVWEALNGSANCRALANAIRKYGVDSFKIDLLHESDDLDELNRLEAHEIETRRTLRPGGYNLLTGGGNSRPCAETRQRMSEGQKAWYSNPEKRQKRSEAFSDPEFRKKQSQVAKAGWANPEYRKRRSERMVDPEYRQKRLQSFADPEFRKKKSASMKAAWSDPEFRKRVSAASNAAQLARLPNIFCDGRIYSSLSEAQRAFSRVDVRYRIESTSERYRWWFKLPHHRDPECDAVEECWAIMQWAQANPDHENVPAWMRCRA